MWDLVFFHSLYKETGAKEHVVETADAFTMLELIYSNQTVPNTGYMFLELRITTILDNMEAEKAIEYHVTSHRNAKKTFVNFVKETLPDFYSTGTLQASSLKFVQSSYAMLVADIAKWKGQQSNYLQGFNQKIRSFSNGVKRIGSCCFTPNDV